MRIAWLTAALLAACSSGGGMTDDAGIPDGGEPADLAMGPPDMVWTTAPHLPFPQLAPHFGHVLTRPQLVTVTYTDDGHRAHLESFGDFLPTSQYFATVGTGWGITGASHEAFSWGVPAPTSLDEATLVNNIKNAATAGMLPLPSKTVDADAGVANDQLLYLIYLPSKTGFNDRDGIPSCSTYLGFHSSARLNGIQFFYAILPDCSGNVDDITSVATHEIFEAATDPAGDGFFLDVDVTDPWYGMRGYENGDLCQDEQDVTEGLYTLQRIYSNEAAMGPGSPCLPIPPGEQFYDVTPDPPMAVTVAAGKSFVFKVTGWSLTPMSNWKLTKPWYSAFFTDFDPKATLPASMINNGKTVTITLTVPASAQSGQQGTVQIFSGGTGHFWPLTVIAQ